MSFLKKILILLLAAVFSLSQLGFLEEFWAQPWALWLAAFILTAINAFLAALIVSAFDWSRRNDFFKQLENWLLLGLTGGFTAGVIWYCWTLSPVFYPNMFLPNHFPTWGWGLGAGLVLTVGLLTWTDRRARFQQWQAHRLVVGVKQHLPGILLAACLFIVYFSLAMSFNLPQANTNNIFFASDSSSWRNWIAAETPRSSPMRAAHPLALLLLRPLVIVFAFLLGGDWFYGGLLLIALLAGLTVFLSWHLVRQAGGSPFAAYCFALVLGASASHLVFGALFESYIASAFGLVLFLVILTSPKENTRGLVKAGVWVFGLTLTNLAQSLIVLLAVRRKIKPVLMVGGSVVGVAAALSLLQKWLFSNATLFFLPGGFTGEARFFQYQPGELLARLDLLLKNMLAYSMAGTHPFVRAVGHPFPRFNFLGFTWRNYPWFGFAAVGLWGLAVLLALVLFIRGRPKLNGLALGLLLALGFNAALHLIYGFEIFLYSANWLYALVFFVALMLLPYMEKWWGRVFAVVFLVLLLRNNLWFVQTLLHLVAPYYQ